MKRYRTVDAYIDAQDEWREGLVALRAILNATELEETVKWGAPCYTVNGKNVVGLGAFKSYFGLWFFQGALLKDEKKVLINAQEGTTKAMRQWRFASAREIRKRDILLYVKEAIENQKQNREIKSDRGRPLEIPPELADVLKKNKKLGGAFESFTLGKQREFADYIASAKRAETKQSRMGKIKPIILEGQGLNDKYRNS